MTKDEMNGLLHRLLDLERQTAGYHNLNLPAPQLRPPAAENEIAALREFLSRQSLSAPPSLLTLMSISNGISNFMVLERISLRSISEIIAEHDADAEEWEDEFASLSRFVIGAGTTSAILALDADREGEAGELAAVVVNGRGDRDEYESLPSFLRARLEYQESVLQGQHADRAKLPDN
jgi:hypothetical protein